MCPAVVPCEARRYPGAGWRCQLPSSQVPIQCHPSVFRGRAGGLAQVGGRVRMWGSMARLAQGAWAVTQSTKPYRSWLWPGGSGRCCAVHGGAPKAGGRDWVIQSVPCPNINLTAQQGGTVLCSIAGQCFQPPAGVRQYWCSRDLSVLLRVHQRSNPLKDCSNLPLGRMGMAGRPPGGCLPRGAVAVVQPLYGQAPHQGQVQQLVWPAGPAARVPAFVMVVGCCLRGHGVWACHVAAAWRSPQPALCSHTDHLWPLCVCCRSCVQVPARVWVCCQKTPPTATRKRGAALQE
jgi:hypothetical protein